MTNNHIHVRIDTPSQRPNNGDFLRGTPTLDGIFLPMIIFQVEFTGVKGYKRQGLLLKREGDLVWVAWDDSEMLMNERLTPLDRVNYSANLSWTYKDKLVIKPLGLNPIFHNEWIDKMAKSPKSDLVQKECIVEIEKHQHFLRAERARLARD